MLMQYLTTVSLAQTSFAYNHRCDRMEARIGFFFSSCTGSVLDEFLYLHKFLLVTEFKLGFVFLRHTNYFQVPHFWLDFNQLMLDKFLLSHHN